MIPIGVPTGGAPLLIEASSGAHVGRGALIEGVESATSELRAARGRVVIILMQPSIAAVTWYLGALAAGAAVLPLDPKSSPSEATAFARHWQAFAVVDPGASRPIVPSVSTPGNAGQDRLLLSTSGSTSKPKLVRLSEANVLSNSDQIISALGLEPSEVTLNHLPLTYSYGLSVLHTHLMVGATQVLTGDSPISAGFRTSLERYRVTSVPGVPQHYAMLLRVLRGRDLGALRRFTQAGGRLSPALQRDVAALGETNGARLWVMYGQTEATARIAVRDPERAGDFMSVGHAVPGAALSISADGEIVVTGPQVMQGYASDPSDLATGDQLQGVLSTGDLGWLGPDGELTITGRKSRITKALGTRMNLDEIEASVSGLGVGAVVDVDDRLVMVFEDGSLVEQAAIARLLGAPSSLLRWMPVERIPLKRNGKIDYQLLAEWAKA